MNKVLLVVVLVFIGTTTSAQNYQRIFTRQKVVVDTFFNKYIIRDPYRWLEDVNSPETMKWVKQENKMSRRLLIRASFRTNSYNSISHYGHVKYDTPVKMGDYYFTYAYYDNTGVPALFYKTSPEVRSKLLVDPNYISIKDKIMLKGYSVSKDSKLLAYQYSRNGSDWAEAGVVDLVTGEEKSDHLTGLKFSNIAWKGHGFFYSTLSQHGKFGITYGEKVYYHTVGTNQKEDKLIFQRPNPASEFSYFTTSNERFLVIKEMSRTTGKVSFYYVDFKVEHPHITPLITHIPDNLNIIDSHEGKFIAKSWFHSNNGSIVEIDPVHPYKLLAIAPAYSEALLLDVIPFADRIVAVYQSDQRPILTIYDYSGKVLHNMQFPIATSLGGFYGRYTGRELLFYFTSYTIPPVVYRFNIYTFKKELTKRTEVSFNFKKIVYKEVEYPSKDSVMVPMILVYEKGMRKDGKNPTILKAYGGFGIISSPSFDPGIVNFVHHGGIFAFANIRGGGDKGVKWAKAGRGKNIQKSFDDFIAAAEYLIKEGYTSSAELGATGASNGGLVVAVAAIQRPHLFQVVVPEAAPLDMLRFEKFTVGHWLTYQYGTVRDSNSFKNLLRYSPYQNIKDTVNYPAMLVLTAENDDRVPPFHSYKFVAALQSRYAQKNIILLKTRKKSGHTNPYSRNLTIREKADIYGFITYEIMKKQKSVSKK